MYSPNLISKTFALSKYAFTHCVLKNFIKYGGGILFFIAATEYFFKYFLKNRKNSMITLLKMKNGAFAGLLAASTFLGSCGEAVSSSQTKVGELKLPPLHIVVVQDRSISTQSEERVNTETVQPLLDSIEKRSGSLAYGEITSISSSESFLQFEVAAPPPPPAPDLEKNPMRRRSKEKTAALNAEYRNKLIPWQESARQKRTEFYDQFVLRFNIKRKKSETYSSDVHGALNKMNMIACTAANDHKATWCIILSDMKHDWVGGHQSFFTGLACEANPLLIVGAKGSGNINLKSGSYVNLASFQQAIDYINVHNILNEK
jgi:hypothetical protein